MSNFFYTFYWEIALAFGFGVLGVLTVLFIFPKIKLLDFPHRYNLNRKPIPYPGGIMMVIAFLGSIFLLIPWELLFSWAFLGFMGGLILLSGTCFLDDRIQLSSWIRLIIQSGCAGIVIASGTWIASLTNPFATEAFQLSFLLGSFGTLVWILGFVNAVNWLDGVPNLTISSGIVASVVLGLLSLSPQVQQEELALLCFIFSACMLPFLLANIGKTRFVWGDSGAMAIGFCLAVFSLFSGGKMATVLIVMSIPIFDSIFVISTRIFSKKSPLKGGDKLHLHDMLLQRGWNESSIFGIYFITSVLLGISVLFLDTWGKISLILGFGSIFLGIRIWEYQSKKK